jgi:hypothetical protein
MTENAKRSSPSFSASPWFRGVPFWLFFLAVPLLALPDGAARAADGDAADVRLLEEAGIGTDSGSLLEFFRKRTLGEEDRKHLESLIRQLGDPVFLRREQACHELRDVGATALPFLRPALRHADLEIAHRAESCIEQIERGPGAALPVAALRLLALRQPPEALETLLAYLPFANDEIVEEGTLNAVAAVASAGTGQPVLVTALQDPQPARRAAAVYVLGRQRERGYEKWIYPLLSDPDAKVRFRAAQGLLAAHDKAAVPVLVDLLAKAPEEISWQAEEVLQRLAGDQLPSLPLEDGTAEGRQRRRDSWYLWWRAHGNGLDLANLEQDPPHLGLTLIAQMDAKRVWECGRDGKPRWAVDGLQGPIDAHILPGGRVLIAEYQGQVVTERDLKGRILWEKRLSGNPTVCQRLPNGNTFIATYHQLLEVTRGGKEVYSHIPDPAKGHIYSAQKLPNGHILCISSMGWLLELDSATGKACKTLRATGSSPYSVEPLSGGRFLIANYNQNQVLEVDAAGKTVWQCNVSGAYHATRLPTGNTLVSSHAGRKVLEINREGKAVWELPLDGHVWRVHRR